MSNGTGASSINEGRLRVRVSSLSARCVEACLGVVVGSGVVEQKRLTGLAWSSKTRITKMSDACLRGTAVDVVGSGSHCVLVVVVAVGVRVGDGRLKCSASCRKTGTSCAVAVRCRMYRRHLLRPSTTTLMGRLSASCGKSRSLLAERLDPAKISQRHQIH
jgi:hypothetical protein